jgi:hypothetical protein
MAPVSSAQLALTPLVVQPVACCVTSARHLPQEAIPPAPASVILMGESAPNAPAGCMPGQLGQPSNRIADSKYCHVTQQLTCVTVIMLSHSS